MKPHALVTNDDGIESAFLHRLVEALLPQFCVTVAAPAWGGTGRSMTRHGELEAIHNSSHFPDGVEAWSISGTPTDCVNIALGNLLPEKPDIVLSGINIGFNTTESLILSSGTVAGAIEGVLWDLPAMAFSKCVPNHLFEKIRDAQGQADGDFNASLRAAAAHARADGSRNPSPRLKSTLVLWSMSTSQSKPTLTRLSSIPSLPSYNLAAYLLSPALANSPSVTRMALSLIQIRIPTEPCLIADALVAAYWISRVLENATKL